MGTKVFFALVYHAQSNGACEHANSNIFMTMSKRIFGEPKGVWADELPNILWAHRTSTSRPTGFTPFRLLFGEEAMTSEEASRGSLWVTHQADVGDEAIAKELLEETRIQAVAYLEKY